MKEIADDVNHLKLAVTIMEDDLNNMKQNTIPDHQKLSIKTLEQKHLEAELNSKKCNLLFFNVPSITTPGDENVEDTLHQHLTSAGILNVQSFIFANGH